MPVESDVAYVYSFLFGQATGYLSTGGTSPASATVSDDSVAAHRAFGAARVIDASRTARLLRGRVDLLDGAYIRAAGNRYVRRSIRTAWSGHTPRTVPPMAAVAARRGQR